MECNEKPKLSQLECSVENLLVGMVDIDIITPEKLQIIVKRILRAEAIEKKKGD